MTKQVNINIQRASTIEDAKSLSKQLKQKLVVLHTGTNNLRYQSAEDTAEELIQLTKTLVANGNKVVMSKLLPREGLDLNRKVSQTNYILTNKLVEMQNVTLTNTDAFYHNDRPDSNLYMATVRDGRKFPLLHLNHKGLRELSSQIQNGLKKYL